MTRADIFMPTDGIASAEYDRLRLAQQGVEMRRLPGQIFRSLPAFVLPLIYLLAPSEWKMLLTIAAVVSYLAIQLLLPNCCPILFTLARRAALSLEQRSVPFKCVIDFVTHIKPFVLWGLFLNPPIALLMMGGTAIRKAFVREASALTSRDLVKDPTSLHIRQNIRSLADTESNFISSSAFTITASALFLSGLPAAMTYLVYAFTGVDQGFGYPSLAPQFFHVFFGILLYTYSVGWCMSTLFFKSYFTYPFSYTSFERTLELDQYGVRLSHIKGWFSQVLWFTTPNCWSQELSWNDVRSVEFYVAGIGRMSPLPDKCFSRNSSIYRCLNKFAAIYDAVVARHKPASYLTLHEYPTSQARLGRSIRVNLWELDEQERSRLYKVLRFRAPHAVISEEAQKQLIGTVVPDRIGSQSHWFDPLFCNLPRVLNRQLQPGDSLHSGDFRISALLLSNGQSNQYEVEDAAGSVLSLKEYILPNLSDRAAEFAFGGRIAEESHLYGRIDHHGFPKLLKTFVEDRRMYQLFEKFEGRTLRQIVDENGPLCEVEVNDLGVQLTHLLKLLHTMQSPIVHRDISPDSVILTTDKKLVVCDLSRARDATGDASCECSGRPAYTAPEQFQGALDVRSDVYAVGAVLYFLLVGRDPLPLKCASPLSDGVSISCRLDEIIRRATALQLSERYESAEWLELDLKSTVPAESAVV
ncbi:MAG TPA: protein kinase [Oculatellaceae cyanobacterium]